MQIFFEHRASFVFSLSLFLSVKGGEGIVCRKNDIFGTKDDKTREEVTGRQRFQVVEIFDELIVGGRYTSLRSLTMDRLLLEKILSPDKKSRRPCILPSLPPAIYYLLLRISACIDPILLFRGSIAVTLYISPIYCNEANSIYSIEIKILTVQINYNHRSYIVFGFLFLFSFFFPLSIS